MVQPAIRLVALDLDGTLLTDQKQLTARTRAAGNASLPLVSATLCAAAAAL